MKRILITTAICAAFAGSAFAQQTQSTSRDYFEDPAMVGTFYTDDTMTEMRPVEEMRSAYGALSQEQREALLRQCEQEESRGTQGTALCSQVMTF